MALRGTLGDFGLPDIFQLVGHQQKTGVLLLKDREIEVRIFFVEGNVVKAEQSSRDKADLLGNNMVRARVISEEQLNGALETQQRTLRRLGDILIESGAVDRPTLKEFARLQTTETIYRLFMWRKGTYEFTATPVDYDEQSYEPIRAENILMEGFRMVDEWPSVRKVVPSSRCTFIVLKPLPDKPAAKEDDDILAGMADAFGGPDSGEHEAAPAVRRIGEAERKVYPHVSPNRTVQDIIDLSRLGEFETTKALATMVSNGLLRVVLPNIEETTSDEPLTVKRVVAAAAPVITRVALYAVVAAVVGGLVHLASVDGALLARDVPIARRAALRDQAGALEVLRLRQALETHALASGSYPDSLQVLVDEGLIDARELTFPFRSGYGYKKSADGASYQLALPLR